MLSTPIMQPARGGLSLCSCPCELGFAPGESPVSGSYKLLTHSITAMPCSSCSVCNSVSIKLMVVEHETDCHLAGSSRITVE